MRPSHAVLALVLLLAACGSDAPTTTDPVDEEPGPGSPPGSTLAASPDSIFLRAFLGGGDPPAGEVRLTSTVSGEIDGLTATITYGPGQPSGWLSTYFVGDSTPALLELVAVTGTLPAGDWWADVAISAPGVATPRVVRVYFSVLPRSVVDSAVVIVSLGGYTLYDLSPGTGAITGGGFHCSQDGGVCSQTLPVGTTFTLTAVPDSNNFFLEWQVRQAGEGGRLGCAPETTCQQVVVTGGLEILGFFALDGYSVAVTVAGAGADGGVTGSVGPNPDINCVLTAGVQSGNCVGEQWYGARSTTLIATALPGSIFVGFSGDCTGTSCVLQAKPGGSYAVTATFAKQ